MFAQRLAVSSFLFHDILCGLFLEWGFGSCIETGIIWAGQRKWSGCSEGRWKYSTGHVGVTGLQFSEGGVFVEVIVCMHGCVVHWCRRLPVAILTCSVVS